MLFVFLVANPPERAKDDTTISALNGQLTRKFYDLVCGRYLDFIIALFYFCLSLLEQAFCDIRILARYSWILILSIRVII